MIVSGKHHPVLSKMYLTCFVLKHKLSQINSYVVFYITYCKYKYFSSFAQGMNITSFYALHLMPAFAGRQTRSECTHNNNVCKFHYRRDFKSSATRCGEIYIYIYMY